MTMSKIELPLYTFMLKDGSGAVFLGDGPELFLPLFTSVENASLYKQRDSMECLLVELATREDLRAYISSPPSRGTRDVEFRIMVDPIDSEIGDYVVFPRQSFLDSLT